ncbi:transposase, partial [Streptococcus agalactiae]
QHRKETIERLFGTAKEYHNLRYTREKGKSKMEAKVGLTLACLNIKKLVKMMTGKTCYFTQISQYYWFMGEFGKNIKKTNIKNDVCLHSEVGDISPIFLLYIKFVLNNRVCQHIEYSNFNNANKYIVEQYRLRECCICMRVE